MKECCSMKGMLSFLILWTLQKRPLCGDEIAIEIAKKKGEKPTPGTIYPALKELERKGLIKSKKEGRKVIYHITNKGKIGLKEVCKYFCKCFGEIFEEYKKCDRSLVVTE